MRSKVLEEDLNILANSELHWEQFRNCTFFVTGATGLVGSVFVRMLLAVEARRKLGVHVTALVRDRDKAERVFEDEPADGVLSYICGDMAESWKVSGRVDYILHAAAVTNSKTMVTNPAEVILSSVKGMEKVLELAQEKKVRKMVYLSSMEMYGNVGEKPAAESDLGYLDLSSVRSCYPESKRMCECMANAWADEYGVPVCSARLAQTFGPGILPEENRVFAQFAKSVLEERDIVLRTRGLSEGNYCYIRDVMTALIRLFADGVPGEAYNIVNEETHMQIREMAQMVAEKVAEGRIRVGFDIPVNDVSDGYAADVRLTMCADKMKALGWKPEVGLEEAYQRLIQDMQERKLFL